MKRVFILGAGASHEDGAPLMSDFLVKARELHRSPPQGIGLNSSAFDDVFRAVGELQGIFAKSNLDLENIETLFGLIEMSQLLGKLGGRDKESIANLRLSLITLIVQTLELKMPCQVTDTVVNPHRNYNDLVKTFQDYLNQPHSLGASNISVLSFNYDLGLEIALSKSRIPFDYCLEGPPQANAIPYMKLHGSINWGHCTKCNEVTAIPVGDVGHQITPGHTRLAYYSIGSGISNWKHCDLNLAGPPVIVPPSWNKGAFHDQMGRVWRQARNELETAESIYVIGYSLPETDLFFRYLFSLGTQSDVHLKRMWVVNPDGSGAVEQRFRELLGRSIESRFRFITRPMSDFIHSGFYREAILEP